MKQIYILILGVLFLTNCSNSQTNKKETTLSGNMAIVLNDLLPKGKTSVDVLDSIKQNARQLALTQKLQLSVQQNQQWYFEYIKTIQKGMPLPYHKNLGLTKEEYDELFSYADQMELISSGKNDITIIKNENTIQFKAEGKLELLNAIRIDLNKNIVMIGENELTFSDSINIDNNNNAFKSKWKGYNWSLEDPKEEDLKNTTDFKSLKLKLYKFTIGRLENNGKTVMRIKGQEIEGGVKKISFEIPIIF